MKQDRVAVLQAQAVACQHDLRRNVSSSSAGTRNCLPTGPKAMGLGRWPELSFPKVGQIMKIPNSELRPVLVYSQQ